MMGVTRLHLVLRDLPVPVDIERTEQRLELVVARRALGHAGRSRRLELVAAQSAAAVCVGLGEHLSRRWWTAALLLRTEQRALQRVGQLVERACRFGAGNL